jgi:hypothetical protein
MANEALLTAVKAIVAQVRDKKMEEAYGGYRTLFVSPAFRTYEPNERRQALKLMIHAKNMPFQPAPYVVEAHRAAIEPLTEMVSVHNEPADFEMLGMCHAIVGNEQGAMAVFKAGLAIERERNAQSDLCGALMKRVSML